MLILYWIQIAIFDDSCRMTEILQYKEASLRLKSTELILKKTSFEVYDRLRWYAT